MSVIDTLQKIIQTLLDTHPDPAAPVQELFDKATDQREKEEIKALAWGFGIHIKED